MQLSMFSDYALRVLVHLAASPDKVLTTRQIAELHAAKYNHLSKVTGWLVHEGYARSARGRGGGLRLARDPSDINLGRLLRDLEADKPLVECMGAENIRCRLAPACGLSVALHSAQDAFFGVLDEYSLDRVLTLSPGMGNLLSSLDDIMTRSDPPR